MPYQGVALVFLVGVGIATAAIMYFLSTNEFQQPHRSNTGYGDDETIPPGWYNSSDSSSSTRRRSRSGNNGICGICFEDMYSSGQLRKLRCTHTFHVACIERWGQQKRACPFCRVSF